MNFIEERIREEGCVKSGGVLKVDAFLNHQIDMALVDEIAAEFVRRFADTPVNKVLTIETSGIILAGAVARLLKSSCPSTTRTSRLWWYPESI